MDVRRVTYLGIVISGFLLSIVFPFFQVLTGFTAFTILCALFVEFMPKEILTLFTMKVTVFALVSFPLDEELARMERDAISTIATSSKPLTASQIAILSIFTNVFGSPFLYFAFDFLTSFLILFGIHVMWHKVKIYKHFNFMG